MIAIYSDATEVATSVARYAPAWALIAWTRVYVLYLKVVS